LAEIRLIAYPVDNEGKVDGSPTFLSPENVCLWNVHRCKSGVSEDGQLVYWTAENPRNARRTDLYIRPLGPLHHPILEPVFIDSITARRGGFASVITSVDATKPFADKSRLLVYVKQPAVKRGSMMLQRIDGKTGQKIGDPVILLEAVTLPSGLKVDPKGRFIIFIVDDPKIGAGLAYQALDATGHASGNPVLLTNLAVSGVDLLPESP
jgi:hypothetical protein